MTPPSPKASSRSPSPSVTSKSAIRRVEASAHLSLQGTAQKRPSDNSSDNGKSPKLTKTSKGNQPFVKPHVPASSRPAPSLFKKPSLKMTRSSNVLPASQSTVNTSFNTVSSSQQTQPDTANTSFTSDADHTEVPNAFFTRTSSTTNGSLDEQDLLTVDAKLSREALALGTKAEPSNTPSQGRDSSSTWGSSIPEEDLLEVSARVESAQVFPPSGLRRLSPQRPVQRHTSSQPAGSPVKDGALGHAKSMAVSPNQSFPTPPGMKAKISPEKQVFQPRMPSSEISPARVLQTSREQTPAESPSKVAHHIRDIPKQGLCVEDVPEESRLISYPILFICQRVALEWSIPLRELLGDVDIPSVMSDPDTLWSSLQSHPKIPYIKSKDPERLWSAPKPGLEGFTFKGQLNLSTKGTGPVFNLQLHPVQFEKSCRFQRRFGSDRFLYLNTPSWDFTKIIRFNKADGERIQSGWNDWLMEEHSFLGRKWRVFHVEPMKRAKTKGKKKTVTHDKRIILFATNGCGIQEPCSIGKMLDWFLPFARNQTQTFCKAYARFDLGLSRTVPTLVFKPSQIRLVDDVKSNGESEATEFNDPTLYWKDIPDNKVMNDGCSRMSVGAAHAIWKHLKKATGVNGPLPSAIQGRIGGAKGMWMISAESFTKDPEDIDIWIEISKSQLKFEPHKADLSDDTFHPHRLTFEVSQFSSSPRHSELHISYIPIMADRGVSRDLMAEYMIERLDAERAELLERLADPVRLYDYIHRNSASSSDGVDMPWQAALPSALEEKIKFLLESGFSPTKLQFLARSVQRFIRDQHLSQESSLRAPLGKCTYLYGVADPLGVLEPGEIHVQFSTSFVDEMTDEKYLSLKGHDVLVSRQPACRRSDIQKVQAIVHPELSHLVDLVVFPSRGQFPLAGKLQGGDYDGDKFWLCWEDKLVRPFKNAPAPVESPIPDEYGIRQDKRKLLDVMDPYDVSDIDEFLRESFFFRNNETMLGTATAYLSKQAYVENRIYSPVLDQICDIHDLLADAAKQGYLYTMTDFERTIQRKLLLPTRLRQPAHKEAMDDCINTKEMGDTDKIREKKYPHKKKNILDYLYFEVLRAHNIATMKRIDDVVSTAVIADTDLLHPRRRLNDYHDPTIDEELRRVQEEVMKIYHSWVSGFHKDHTSNEKMRLVEDCYRRFLAIQPQDVNHPLIRTWVEAYLVPGQCLWDTIRASTLYHKLTKPKASTFVFTMAGRELAELKAKTFVQSRTMIAQIRANMKPKPINAFALTDEDDDDKSELVSTTGDDVT